MVEVPAIQLLAVIKKNKMRELKVYDIEIAYRKLKSYFYYDNFSSHIREDIALFETQGNIKDKFDALVLLLNSKSPLDNIYFKQLLSNITIVTIPKTYKSSIKSDPDEFILTNKTPTFPFELSRVNYLIKAPIEIHIISVLWILNEGLVLQDSYERYNYGYKIALEDTNSNVVDGLRLFDKYFELYQQWRDRSITSAKQLLDNKQDATIIQMDIKEYFHNALIDFKLLKEEIVKLNSGGLLFTDLLERISIAYTKVLSQKYNVSKGSGLPLPIGLLSSGILGNWHLKGFDDKIVSKLAPSFYGRYVDDIVIVLANTPIKRKSISGTPFKNFVKEYFIDRNLFQELDPYISETIYYLNLNSESTVNMLSIQKEKFSILEFSHKESPAALNNFIIKLKENSSIFWMLPEDKKDSRDFDKSANDLIYTDTVNKLRSLNEIVPSKFGASVFLAKSILSSLLSDEKASPETDEQILRFFQGKYSLDFYQLWEKVCTYFIINNKSKEFWKFFRTCFDAINEINSKEKDLNSKVIEVKSYLVNHLKSSIALAVSLKPEFLFNENSNINKRFTQLKGGLNLDDILNLTIAYRKSNLIRHNYVTLPLLNYTKYSTQFNSPYFKSLLIENEIKFLESIDLKDIEIDFETFKYSPRYIHLFETNLYKFYVFILKSRVHIDENLVNFNKLLTEEVVNKSFELFDKLNYSFRLDLPTNFKTNYQEKLFRTNDDETKYTCIEIGRPKDEKNIKVSVSVANHKIFGKDIEPSMKNELFFSNEKKENLIRILNQAEEEKSEILILPEISIPFKWLNRIADESRRKQRAIIGGIEHFSLDRYCYNYMLTVIPIDVNGIQESLIIPRLKNHYIPEEEFLIESIRYKVPRMGKNYYYHLFKWKGINFTTYNCYELADVVHRSLFRSKVDIIFASEYNKDWKYFSNVAESITRDIHCYYVQSNTSDIGDSRIIQPTESNRKDILRLKGGQKSSVLTAILDVTTLRNFQEKEYKWQRGHKEFKSTPPDFDKESIKNR